MAVHALTARDAAGTHMGKVLVQCGASEQARRGVPAAPRSSPLPSQGAEPAAAADGAECRAPEESAEPAAHKAPEPDASPAEVRAQGPGCCRVTPFHAREHRLLAGALSGQGVGPAGLLCPCKSRVNV